VQIKEEIFTELFSDSLIQINQVLQEYENYYALENKKFYEEHKATESQLKKDTEFVTNSDKYLNAAKDELLKKKKHLDTIKTSMRTAIASVNSKKLSELKVQENPSLLKLFRILFSVLYKAGMEEFDWSKFKKTVLIKDKCDDFISRAAALDPLEVPKPKLDELTAIKQDEWLKKFVSEDPKGDSVLDIMDYLEYIPECVKAETDILEIETNIKNIKRDAVTRKARIDISKKKIEILEENYNYLNESYKKISEHKVWVQELTVQVQDKLDELDRFSRKIVQEIHEAYDNNIRKVPDRCYEA